MGPIIGRMAETDVSYLHNFEVQCHNYDTGYVERQEGRSNDKIGIVKFARSLVRVTAPEKNTFSNLIYLLLQSYTCTVYKRIGKVGSSQGRAKCKQINAFYLARLKRTYHEALVINLNLSNLINISKVKL